MPESLTEADRRIDRQTRKIAQEAKLDTDLGAMVPPRWRGSTVIVAVVVVMTLGIMLATLFL